MNLLTGKSFKGELFKYNITYSSELITDFYPLLLKENGEVDIFCPSPFHGRSVITNYINKTDRYIIIKGCGLTYFPYNFSNTGEVGDGTWGLLLKDDAIRDYICGNYISKLGIYTNKMEAVLEITNEKFNTGKNILNPYILQYSVDCPYRLADAPFLPKNIIKQYVKKWGRFGKIYSKKHLIVADVIFKNLRIMHDNEILHNAINIQNYTLSLELLDFELSRTPEMPYNKEDELIFKDLFKRETFYCLEIINFICYLFKEDMDSKKLGQILKEYGYSI